MQKWIVCQLGAREHYAFARALSQINYLDTLVTDAWVRPNSLIHLISSRFSKPLLGRYHDELDEIQVRDFTPASLPFELKLRLSRGSGWTQNIARNNWFQRYVLSYLKEKEQVNASDNTTALFSYSYTALKPFSYAKKRGWKTILGQIDAGIVEEQCVARLQAKYSQHYSSSWHPAPSSYWQNWKKECHLADYILVNSLWSKNALIEAGIPSFKINIVPLAYQEPTETKVFTRQYPKTFTNERPLKVLFLGQIVLRKGIAAILDSLKYIADKPIEIWLVGPNKLSIPTSLCNHPNLRLIGRVPRSQVQKYYKQADVFLFPTHSDGFGLTQLEAQAWNLPIIASRYCGEVIKHKHNGFLLEEITPQRIATVLSMCCLHPQILQEWSSNSYDMNLFSIEKLSQLLKELMHEM